MTSVQQNRASAPIVASLAVCASLAMLVALQFVLIAQGFKPTLDPLFCSPTSLHTTVEPPETQLTRDYRAIRILLKDARDQFRHVRRIYEGELHVSAALSPRSAVLKRADRAQLAMPAYRRQPWPGSLRQEVERIDRAQRTAFGQAIDTGLEGHVAAPIESAFRQFFASMLDELLVSVEQRLDRSIVVDRAIQHARRYYGEGVEAYLNIRAPEQAQRAQLSLDAMERALQEFAAGDISARAWFARERVDFTNAVREGLAA